MSSLQSDLYVLTQGWTLCKGVPAKIYDNPLVVLGCITDLTADGHAVQARH